MARTTVSAKGRKSSPAMPSTSRIGTNTMTVTTVEEITADETSPVALVIVLSFDSPLGACLRCRMMFSMTTMESSTMRPMVIINPARDIILTVVPVASMPTNANSTDNGMVIPVMMVGRSDNRNTKMTKTADRKSTRLNSSHVSISYAVFCLKKKKQITSNPKQKHH